MGARPFLLLAMLLAAPTLAGLAQGHAVPVTSVPASGAVLQAPPREVRIAFSERVDPGPSGIDVRASNGTVVSGRSEVLPDGITVRASLPASLDHGPYTVAWRTTSAVDGHSTRGILSFLYHDPSKPLNASDLPPEGQQEALVSPLDPPLRALGYAGMLVGFGTAVVMLVVAPRGPSLPSRRPALLALAACLAGAVGALGLALSQQAAAAQLGGTSGLFSGRFGELALARAGLLALAGALAGARLVGPARHAARLWSASALLLLGAMLAMSLSSHAAALPSFTAIAIGLDTLHLAAGGAWVGGIVALGWVLWRGTGEEPGWDRLALRYSSLAWFASLAVVGTGVVQGVLELKTLDALLGSSYGQVLMAKSALVLGLLGFGGLHRFRLIPALQRRAGRAWHRLGSSLRQEAVLGIAVICVAGLLTSLSPPYPPAPPGPPPVVTYGQVKDGENLTVLLSPNPVRVGQATLDLFLYDAAGLSDTNATNVTLTLRPPDATLGTSQSKLQHPHPGHFATEGPLFAMPGTWTLRFDVQRSGAFDVVADFQVPVEAAG
ncbi:MAG: copper resistance protein CopC/CopD [Halobacteriales archaeon]|nr:copper resistance protein CopC/CopD [Halobacteriales archaeon]